MNYFTALVYFLAVLFAARQAGFLSLSRFYKGDEFFEFSLEREVFALGLGLVFVSLSVLALGLFGVLYKQTAWLGLLVFSCAAFFNKTNLKTFKLELTNPFLIFCAVAVFAAFFFSFLQCFAPSISNDALAYHLAHPKAFVAQHRITYLPLTRESLWPSQTEMLFTLGLLLQGTALAQLFHWVFYPLCALAIFFLAERVIQKGLGKWAALIFVFTPAIYAQSSQAYVDLALAFYITLSLYFFCVDKSPKAAFASGIFSGAALGVKSLALGSAAITGFLWIAASSKRVKSAVFYLTGIFLIGSIWYLRSFFILGNPVYPFFPHFFGGHGYESLIGNENGFGKTPSAFLFLLWNLTLKPDRFGGEMIGPLFLMFLPAAIFEFKKTNKNGLYLILFSLFYSLFLFGQSQQARFFISVLPILSIGAACGLNFLINQNAFLKKTVLTFFAAVVLLHSALFIYKAKPSFAVLAGRQGTVDYLTQYERSFKMMQYLNTHAFRGEKIFNAAEIRSFYAEVPMIMDGGPLRRDLETKHLSLAGFLHQQQFDYICTAEEMEPDLKTYLMGNGYQKVFSSDFSEGGVRYTHLVWQKSGKQESELDLADAYYRAGRYAEALTQYEKAVPSHENDSAAHFNYGLALKQNGKIEDAFTQYNAALKINPEYVEVLLERGVLNFRLKGPTASFDDFKEAARLAPKNAQAHFWLGRALQSQNRLQEAIQEYQLSLDLWPYSTEARFWLAKTYFSSGNRLRALWEWLEIPARKILIAR